MESMIDMLAVLHTTHDCNLGPCVCKCGCMNQLGCRAALGGLCSMCQIEVVRYGNVEHGFTASTED
jgi:hypothetical protein